MINITIVFHTHGTLERAKAEELIINIARFNVVDIDLALAIAEAESQFDEYAARFEANWKYLLSVESFAKSSHISGDTERIFQMTSWGMMQVMGSVARELGHRVNLNMLTKPELGLKFGCLKLREVCKRYSKLDDQISAYNSGIPKLTVSGQYYNQTYVNKVRGLYVGRRSEMVKS